MENFLVRNEILQRLEFYSISSDYTTRHLKRSYTLSLKQFQNDKKNNFLIAPFYTLLHVICIRLLLDRISLFIHPHFPLLLLKETLSKDLVRYFQEAGGNVAEVWVQMTQRPERVRFEGGAYLGKLNWEHSSERIHTYNNVVDFCARTVWWRKCLVLC